MLREIATLVVAPVLVTAALFGCAVAIVGSQKWFEEYGRQPLASRASFDLDCPESSIQFAPLGSDGNYEIVGASGCGKKASYVWAKSPNNKWVLNSNVKGE